MLLDSQPDIGDVCSDLDCLPAILRRGAWTGTMEVGELRPADTVCASLSSGGERVSAEIRIAKQEDAVSEVVDVRRCERDAHGRWLVKIQAHPRSFLLFQKFQLVRGNEWRIRVVLVARELQLHGILQECAALDEAVEGFVETSADIQVVIVKIREDIDNNFLREIEERHG